MYRPLKVAKALFQHTAARRRLDLLSITPCIAFTVSTHSRPKAAGWILLEFLPPLFQFQHTAARRRLARCKHTQSTAYQFQHTAARRRLDPCEPNKRMDRWFQHTAARRRLGNRNRVNDMRAKVSTHSRPKAAGLGSGVLQGDEFVSTHSRPKAAGL